MIRKYQDADLNAVLDAWYSASLVGHPFLTEAFFAEERQMMATQYLPNAETWVYEENGQTVAFISMLENEVGGLFVHADYHRRGLGRALLDHVKQTRAFLTLEVFEENLVGRRFYEKYGFKKIGQGVNDATGQVVYKLQTNVR